MCSSDLREPVTGADVLRLGLDGRLPLLLYLPAPTRVRGQATSRDGLSGAEEWREIQGLCELPLTGRARLQVEQDYQWETTSTAVASKAPVGATVMHDGWQCQLPPDPGVTGVFSRSASEFPAGSQLVVRVDDVHQFIASHGPPASGRTKAFDAPLDPRERTTLLVVIAALCAKAKWDLAERGTAQAIATLTSTIGASVNDDTVRKVLAQVADALASRAKRPNSGSVLSQKRRNR